METLERDIKTTDSYKQKTLFHGYQDALSWLSIPEKSTIELTTDLINNDRYILGFIKAVKKLTAEMISNLKKENINYSNNIEIKLIKFSGKDNCENFCQKYSQFLSEMEHFGYEYRNYFDDYKIPHLEFVKNNQEQTKKHCPKENISSLLRSDLIPLSSYIAKPRRYAPNR